MGCSCLYVLYPNINYHSYTTLIDLFFLKKKNRSPSPFISCEIVIVFSSLKKELYNYYRFHIGRAFMLHKIFTGSNRLRKLGLPRELASVHGGDSALLNGSPFLPACPELQREPKKGGAPLV